MELSIYNIGGSETGRKANLDSTVFGVAPNEHVMWLDVKQILANRRQGTHSSRERSQMSGSTRKLKRQKGTGGARAGSIKSGTIVGGARIFGPHPRDYHFKLNKKVKTLARKSALSSKAKDGGITVIEQFNFDAPKTKSFTEMITNLNLADKKFLFVTDDYNKNIYLSGRNLPKGKIVSAGDINTYDLLNCQTVILMEGSVKKIEELLKKD
ncbi:MAG: 50S ribosomal protein L4 [Bacteroidota bacterium]|nr:50S ribosomal protein L4 [Bacteroidota bacterium]